MNEESEMVGLCRMMHFADQGGILVLIGLSLWWGEFDHHQLVGIMPDCEYWSVSPHIETTFLNLLDGYFTDSDLSSTQHYAFEDHRILSIVAGCKLLFMMIA